MAETKYQKVKGILTGKRGEASARIKVLSFKKNGHYTISSDEIKATFEPDGHVFAKGFFNNHDFDINTILEFSTMPNELQVGQDRHVLDPKGSCKKLQLFVFTVDENILSNELSINQPILKRYINATNERFYIVNQNFLYGPFLYSNEDVKPVTGKEVNRYAQKPQIITINEKNYLLEEPSHISVKIDCMTNAQLAVWFKDQMHSISPTLDPEKITELIETQEISDLNTARLHRALTIEKDILLTRRELQDLTKSNPTLENIVAQSIASLKEEIKNEFRSGEIEPLAGQRDQLQRECNTLQQSKTQLHKFIETVELNKKKLLQETQYLENEKERIIQDIKIQTQLQSVQPNSFSTLEKQTYVRTGHHFDDLKSFLTRYRELFESLEPGAPNIRSCLFQLQKYRAILVSDPKLIQWIARFTNNCYLFIQQVEGDWLKFQYLYENGLSQVWHSAVEYPDIIHFLVIEDINLSSIECYGKPLLDFLSKFRTSLPGLGSSWPLNLWIFGVPTHKTEDHSFGLPMIPNSFEDWGAFPIFTPAKRNIQIDTRHLTVNALHTHFEEYEPSYKSDYFL